jgi:hypothetical protein
MTLKQIVADVDERAKRGRRLSEVPHWKWFGV